jgi:hypothetical protein
MPGAFPPVNRFVGILPRAEEWGRGREREGTGGEVYLMAADGSDRRRSS